MANRQTFTEWIAVYGYDFDNLPYTVRSSGQRITDNVKIAKMWNDWRTT